MYISSSYTPICSSPVKKMMENDFKLIGKIESEKTLYNI